MRAVPLDIVGKAQEFCPDNCKQRELKLDRLANIYNYERHEKVSCVHENACKEARRIGQENRVKSKAKVDDH